MKMSMPRGWIGPAMVFFVLLVAALVLLCSGCAMPYWSVQVSIAPRIRSDNQSNTTTLLRETGLRHAGGGL